MKSRGATHRQQNKSGTCWRKRHIAPLRQTEVQRHSADAVSRSSMAADADLRARVEQLERSLAEARVALSDERAVHEKERIEWNQDRQKLRTLEQQFLLDRAHNAAKSRQWRVSGGLAGLGAVILITATPFVIVQPFGLLGGGLGYGPAACCTGIALFFLAALPVYARLVRLLSGFIVWVATLNCCIWILVPLLSVSGAFCGFPSPEMCNVVVAGMSGSSLTLGSWIIAMAVRTLRLVPAAEDEGERVPLSKVWPWAVARVGPWAAAFGMVMAFPGVWAAAQPDSSFVMSPRAALIFHWQILRLRAHVDPNGRCRLRRRRGPCGARAGPAVGHFLRCHVPRARSHLNLSESRKSTSMAGAACRQRGDERSLGRRRSGGRHSGAPGSRPSAALLPRRSLLVTDRARFPRLLIARHGGPGGLQPKAAQQCQGSNEGPPGSHGGDAPRPG